MEKTYSSGEILIPNKFATINGLPENMAQKNNSKKQNSTRTRTYSQEKHPDNSTHQAPERRKKSKERYADTRSASSLGSEHKSRNPVKRCFHWMTQCCRAPKRRKTSKRSKNFWKRVKERFKRCRRKKQKTGDIHQTSTSTAGYPESSDTVDKRRLSKSIDEIHGKRSKSRKKRTKDSAAISDGFDSFVSPLSPADQGERNISDLMQEKGLPDFTKSCCYMCANAMAFIGAKAAADKLHVSIQASDSFIEKFDKSSNPMSYVRTVKSSVKVKMRNVGTHYSEEKKSKKPRLKLKNLKDAVSHKLPKIQNVKAAIKSRAQNVRPKDAVQNSSKPPTMQSVACGTNTSTKHTNTPQCMAKNGTQCVRKKK